MKLDLLYNGETGEYRICLRPAEEMPLLPPPGALTRLPGASAPEDMSWRRCIELFTGALLADRAGDRREAQGDAAGARAYRQKAREQARRALRLLWRIRDDQTAASAGVPPHVLPTIAENESEARARQQAAKALFGPASDGSRLSPESMSPAPETNN